jgi:uncharacterized secreted protein with C-terminal beta-propeller domain
VVLKKQYQDTYGKYVMPVVGTFGALSADGLGLTEAADTGLGVSESAAKVGASAGSDYSSTNVQVTGVDEADLVKTDGKYIYGLSFDYSAKPFLTITKAVPASQAEIVGRVQLEDGLTPAGFYLSGDYVLVVTSGNFVSYKTANYYYSPSTVVQIFNVKNKTKPFLVRTVMFEGSSVGSRVIGNYAYLVLRYYGSRAIGYDGKISTSYLLPKYKDANGDVTKAQASKAKDVISCANVNYLTPTDGNDYLEIVALPIGSSGKINSQVVIGTGGSEIYVSPNNLYVATPRSGYYSWWKKEVTDIHKFSLKNGKINLVATQVVPGTVLNQFSLDEQNGNLRLATTEGQGWGWLRSGAVEKNSLYILDKNLNRIGWYENFGEGEKIYSARFMDDRAYVVTFKETDPMFVFDLKDPRQPKLLGELSMPGYSTYLHPYDANHLIGIGKQAISDTTTPGFAWYQGLKIGLFDVTDPANPIELSSREIGDRGSNSEALSDHHAFLFSKLKNLLAFPVQIYQLTEAQKKSGSLSEYGSQTFSGLYVYNVNTASGFSFLGGIAPNEIKIGENDKGDDQVYRSLYIGDYLYVISYGHITVVKLSNLEVVKEIDLVIK